MPLLSAQNVKKSFVERLLFDEVSFEINDGEHVGLVGVNGCGKTTLIRILRGLEPYDSGNVYRNKDLRFGVMSQSVENDALSLYEYTLKESQNLIDLETETEALTACIEKSTGEQRDKLIQRQDALRNSFFDLGGLTFRARTRSVLMGLGFSEQQLNQPLNTMSGGQRNKAQLARVLLSDANLLLLDEPTNHLDITSITWLEDFLASYPHAFIVISHDRYFLDKVTSKTLEIKNTKLFYTPGNYSRHIELQSTQNEIMLRHYQNTQKEIRRIMGIVEQQRRWGQERNFITAESKLKQAERLKATLVAPERDTDGIHFHFHAADGCGNDVIVAKDLSKSYDGKSVFSGVNLHILKGEHVFILGENGCGKTTLLRILSRRERPDAGNFYYGTRVKMGYYDQNVSSGITGSATLLDEIHNAYPLMNHGEIRSAMAQFLFKGDAVFREAKLASGGERARVQLLKLMLSGSNLLFLDEPTNHLDIASREALENALADYDGTMIIVTHDRYLVNRLADRILHMTPTGIVEYIGGYDEFLSATKEAERRAKEEKSTEARACSQQSGGAAYKQQKEMRSALARAKGEVKRLEEKIIATEDEQKSLELRMANTGADYKKLMELSAVNDAKRIEIDELYAALDEATAKLSELTEAAGDCV